MHVLPNFTYRFHAIPIKITEGSFLEIGRLIFLIIWKYKGTETAKTALKNSKVEGLNAICFQDLQ